MSEPKIVTIVGGTGFVGRYVVRLLAKAGYRMRVVARNAEAALPLKTSCQVGQIALINGNLARPQSIARALDHSYAVINLVGVLFESGNQNFAALHARGAEALAKMAASAKVSRFVQMSALGIDKAERSHYALTKLQGEKAVLEAFPKATILRPSVIFGPEDHFFNQFAAMAGLLPALPLIGRGRARFQPVYVGDVAQAIGACLTRDDVFGQTYELGGLSVYSFREILEYVMSTTGKERALLPLPMGLASVMGAFGEIWPRPPLTRDQVRLLGYDNVVNPNAKTLAHLGISATPVDAIVPNYLARFRRKMAA